jgi:glucokinase
VRRIAVCDVGGTHARFAIASLQSNQAASLSDPVTLRTSDHPGLQSAWEEFGRRLGEALPRELAIAFAGPVGGDALKLTNSAWMIRPADLKAELGADRLTLVNDFGAVAYAVPWLGKGDFRHLCGPERPLPEEGVITIVGPGTGLGVASLLRRSGGSYDVIETEGGHMDFAPLDGLEDRILAELRQGFQRVSVERLVSGRGLWNIYQALGAIEDRPLDIPDEKALWSAALDGGDSFAVAALDRLCLSLGAIAGDLALAQGADAVVIAGGVGLRLAEHLQRSGFRDRFIAKGRFAGRMDAMPVKLVMHPQPGLLGAAAAFLHQHP